MELALHRPNQSPAAPHPSAASQRAAARAASQRRIPARSSKGRFASSASRPTARAASQRRICLPPRRSAPQPRSPAASRSSRSAEQKRPPPPHSRSALSPAAAALQIGRAARPPPDASSSSSTCGNEKNRGGERAYWRGVAAGDLRFGSGLAPDGRGRGGSCFFSLPTSVAGSCLSPRRVLSWVGRVNIHAHIHEPLGGYFWLRWCICSIHVHLHHPLGMLLPCNAYMIMVHGAFRKKDMCGGSIMRENTNIRNLLSESKSSERHEKAMCMENRIAMDWKVGTS